MDQPDPEASARALGVAYMDTCREAFCNPYTDDFRQAMQDMLDDANQEDEDAAAVCSAGPKNPRPKKPKDCSTITKSYSDCFKCCNLNFGYKGDKGDKGGKMSDCAYYCTHAFP